MPSENTKILEFNQYQKSDKAHLSHTSILPYQLRSHYIDVTDYGVDSLS